MIGDFVMDEFPIERAKVTHEADFDALSKVLDGGELTFNVLYESLGGMVPNHAFFITKMGYIGMGPPRTRPGDQIWVFYGGRVPFIMRRNNLHGLQFEFRGLRLVGDAYVHGIMDGEAVRDGHQTHRVTLR
jgi:hypothetical protein